MACRPIYQDVRDVGKNISSTKKLYIWKFSLDEREYTIELFNSVLSGKKKITQNGQIIYENNSYQGAFNFPFSIGRNSLSIVQHGDKFELRINNQSFAHLYNQRQTQSHFKSDQFQSEYPKYDSDKPPKKNKNRNLAPDDDDEEIRKAIELSKQTALMEEKKRLEEVKKISQNSKKSSSNHAKEKQIDPQDFDIGSGFEKFSTFQKKSDNNNFGGNDINDFDFNQALGNNKNKNQDDFNFNFDDNNQQKKESQKNTVPDLLDLLGGGPIAQTNNVQQPVQQQNALDFFNNGTGNLGLAANQNAFNQNQQQNAFGFGAQDPFNQNLQNNNVQQMQQAQMQQQQFDQQNKEKPKFIPNPVFMSQMQPNISQQQLLYQQQIAGGMMQNPYGQYGTGMMNQNQNYFGGMGQQAFGTQQIAPQQQNPFDAFGNQNGFAQPNNNFGNMGGQNMMHSPQKQSQTQSTPFDMF